MLAFVLTFACVAAATGIAWTSNGRSLLGIDDANIYFVYMRNLADGNGFVYYPGGERVEGFSSLLWTLWGALLLRAGVDLETGLLFTSAFLISFALSRLVLALGVWSKEKRLPSPSAFFLLGTLLVVPGYFEWTVLSLMETGLWSCLLILLSLEILEARSDDKPTGWGAQARFSFLIGLLILCRPEALAWAPIFLAARWINTVLLGAPARRAAEQALLPSAVALFSAAGLLFWRWSYFGFPLPNTFYAKVSSDFVWNLKTGLAYLGRCLEGDPLVILSALLASCGGRDFFTFEGLRRHHKDAFVILVTGATLALPVVTGGDHFAYARFVQPMMPIVLLAIVFSAQRVRLNLTYPSVFVFLVFASFVPDDTIYRNLWNNRSPMAHEWEVAREGRQSGHSLNRFFDGRDPYPSQGVLSSGGTALVYKGPTIDLLGLSNPAMAHRARVKRRVLKNHASFNADVFFQQVPDLFWYGGGFSCEGTGSTRLAPSEMERRVFQNIETDPRFPTAYSGVTITRKDRDCSLTIFAANGFLATLDPNVYSYRSSPFDDTKQAPGAGRQPLDR